MSIDATLVKERVVKACITELEKAHHEILQAEMYYEENDKDEESKITSWFLKNIEGMIAGCKSYHGIK